MRYLLAVAALAAPAVAHSESRTTTVCLSSSTPTAMPKLNARRFMLVENRGQTAIACGYGDTVTYLTGHVISPGQRLSFPDEALWCIAKDTNQVALTGCTVVSEVS